MNYEKIGYSFIGSLVAGSIIQKNMGMDQHYFYIISAFFLVMCIGTQWWNCRRNEKIREKNEKINSEQYDAIIQKITGAISESSEKEINYAENKYKEINRLIEETKKSIETFCQSESSALCDILECHKNNTSVLESSFNNLDSKLLDNLNKEKEIHDAIVSNGNVITETQNLMREKFESCNDIGRLIKDEIISDSKEHKTLLSSICSASSDIVAKLEMTNETTRDMSEKYNDLCGILSNLQSVLDNTDNNIVEIKNIDADMYSLIVDLRNDTDFNLKEIDSTVKETINEKISASMESQRQIIDGEQEILVSYDKLLGRINDEVIAKMISDSDTLLKCIRDFYNLLESQRRAKNER